MAHVLFMDIVAYSTFHMDRQQQLLHDLQEAVRSTPTFARAQAEDQLIRLPTGDGIALVFFHGPEAPVHCALELARILGNSPSIKLRMGIHTGPVYRVADINANRNVAGGGINIAQRVMDCGDAGHILVSSTVAELLGQVSAWSPMLHNLGEVKVKHGLRIHLYNLYTDDAGNPALPNKVCRRVAAQRPALTKTKKRKVTPAEPSVPVSTAATRAGLDLKRNGSAVAFAEVLGAADRRDIGSVIETHGNPFLESKAAVEEMGWPPERVLLKLRKGRFDARAILADTAVIESFEKRESQRIGRGEGTSLKLPDGTKYVAVDASSPFLEVDDFAVTLQETRYFDILRARPAIEESFDVRLRYAHTDPEKSRVPQALGVQFIALFADRELLVIRRAKDTFPWPGTWSFSGEEQCAPIDVSWDEPVRMRNFLLRTAVEEIFPLARRLEPAELLEVMRMVEPYVKSMRTWSLFLEVPTVTFSFFSVFTFELSIKEYEDRVKEMVHQGLGQSSREGRYFSVPVAEAAHLIKGNAILASPLFGGNAIELSPSLLHPTSLYRLTRLLESMRM